LRRGTHRSTRALTDAIRQYLTITNETPKPFIWTKTADEILNKMRHFGIRTQQVHGAGA